MATDTTAQIQQAMTSPASVSADGVSVRVPSIGEQIEAAQYLASISAMKKKRKGMTLQRIIPDGAL